METTDMNIQELSLDIIDIVKPIVIVLFGIYSPIILQKIVNSMHLRNEADQKAVENALKESIHKAAVNGLKVAVARTGTVPVVGEVSKDLLAQAIDYVSTKNAGDMAKLGLSKEAVGEIILSKVPDLVK